MLSFLWIILSYLLGSIPFGFIISRAFGKEILKIGWRKTSGSNVFKNVGKWQGILTGILDVLKGYLAVFGAQKLGLPSSIQIFSGVAAITGHNWSCFIKFAGGRGIGTFIGTSLALFPKILGLSLIPLVLLALIWNASIGTLLFLITAIFLSWHLGQFEIAGVFTIFSLIPILIKRLSPIKEISQAKNPAVLIRNRLLFDNDQFLSGLRIKRIFQEKKSNPGKITKIIKILSVPILLPPKIGLKTAKYGVKIAKKPIQPAKEILSRGVKRLVSRAPQKVVTEIGIEDLKNLMIASAKKVILHQEEINRINVFPVADKDTGYNLAATLLGIEGAISQREYHSILELTRDIKEGAITNARGNAGMIYTGYLIRFLDGIKNLKTVDGKNLAKAMRKGTKAAYLSILNPVEGTILDVIKVSGEKAYEIAKIKKPVPEKNIIKILEGAHKTAKIALAETKEKLEVLKQNDVVDAGALGFIKILEAWIESLKGLTPIPEPELTPLVFEPKPEEKLEFRYEVMSCFKKKEKMELEKLKNELSLLGNSLDTIELEDKIKIHIHTNFPERIREKIKDFEILEWRVEDMAEQIKKTKKRPLGLVVDSVSALPREFLKKYDIEEVPCKVIFQGKETDLSGKALYEKMREAIKTSQSLPTTSIPSIGDFVSAYERALENFEKILVITLSRRLSGVYSGARVARSTFKKPQKLNITIFDSLTAEVGEALVVIKAQELISQGKKLEEILQELRQFCPEVKFYGALESLKYISAGGRLRIPLIVFTGISLIQKIGIRPLIEIKEGKVKFRGVRLGKNMAKLLAKKIEKLREGKEIRVAIAHADNLKAAEDLKAELEKRPKVKVLFISEVSPVVGVHAGPGTLLAVFCLV